MKLYSGDCLIWMNVIPDASVDMIFCDLPYGTTANKWDSIIPYEPLWEHYRRICKGPVVLTAAQPFTSALVMSNVKDFKYQWVWEKPQGTGFLNAKKQPLRSTEDVLVFYKTQCIYNPQKTYGHSNYKATSNKGSSNYRPFDRGSFGAEDGSRYPTTILNFNQEKGFHPTQKLVALMEYLIRTYTHEGMTVLDNCMGSGTTGVACVNTGREFIGIERYPEYFAIAQQRIADAMFMNLERLTA